MKNLNWHITFLMLLCMCLPTWAQDFSDTATMPADTSLPIINFDQLTKEDVQKLTLEQLLQLPFDQLLKLSQKLGISVEELLNITVTAPSKSELTPRETPGIISVITEEDIKKSGARDLVDVLRLVPGYSFGYDVQGVVGIGSRGLWAHEGKMLLLIDGQEMNELYYSTIPIVNHYPIENIKRIELIRGPGSSIYGGNAELGVINIITKKGDDLHGASATETFGLNQNGKWRTNQTLSIGHKVKDFDFSLTHHYSDVQKTNGRASFPDTGRSNTQNKFIDINMSYKKLKANIIYDDYSATYADFNTNKFSNFLFDLRYDFNPIKKLTITPRLNYKYNTPWYSDQAKTNKRVIQYTVGLLAKYDLSQRISLIAGTENILSEGHLFGSNVNFKINNKPFIDFYNQSYFIQALVKTDFFNVTLGGRYDVSGTVRSDKGIYYYQWFNAFAPRVGITKVYDKFHYKLLVSKAFRTPSIGNMDLSVYTKDGQKHIAALPENTYIQEMEFGYKFNKKMFLTCNLFNANIQNPIVYQQIKTPTNDTVFYWNSTPFGTMGVELEFRYRTARHFITVSYSYYHAGSLVFLSNNKFVYYEKPGVSVYQSYGDASKTLGFSNHKVTFSNCYRISENWSISNSIIFMSRYDAYVYSYDYSKVPPQLLMPMRSLGPSLLWNLFVEYSDLGIKGLNLGAGVYDILDNGPDYPQPYVGYRSPIPGPAREFIIRLSYNFQSQTED